MANKKEKLEKGWILCRVVLEIVGKPKEHVEKAIKDYVEAIKKDEDMEVTDAHIAEVIEHKTETKEKGMVKDLWATFAELEIMFKDMTTITYFCFNYMPSSVEIIEPQSYGLKAIDLSRVFNDLQARLHQVDLLAKQLRTETVFLKKQMTNLLKNFIVILLAKGEMTAEQITKFTGVGKATIEDYLDKLVDQGEVEMNGDKYKWKKKETK